MAHDCKKNPEDCDRVHGQQSTGISGALGGGLLGAIAGIPLSYYFQPAIIRAKLTLSDYLRALPDVLGSEYASNFYAGVFVCSIVGAIIGKLIDP